jgi:mannose/cellobiose epimerase-like protein (N-acyl-D-glucosamine 2-epimerase family)
MAQSSQALEAHLRDELLPWWRDHGVDRIHGGFHETLGPDGAPGPEGERRLRSLTRLIYAFGVGVTLAVPGARELAEGAFAHLLRAHRDPDHGGFFRTTDLRGAPLDRSKDTYDHAFAVLALVHHHAACGDRGALELAAETASLVGTRLGDDTYGGYFEGGAADWTPTRAGPRRQNPHMHWVEALLGLHAETGDARWLGEADRLVALCAERFVDPRTGTLGETFGRDWGPATSGDHDVVEPGHHYEWVWLLARHREAGGQHTSPELAERLFGFAESFGVREHGDVVDAVARDGTVVESTRRLWPQTERVKALAVRGVLPELEAALERCFAAYLAPRGGWHERLAADGSVADARQRATSVYHVVLAWTEAAHVLRSRGL